MNELQIFNSPEFGQVRTIKHGDTVLFCANDVAVALSYKKPNNAINRHCKHATLFQGIITDSLGRKQDANFIPYGDVVRLATRSELPNADIFEGWIFDEVIPSVMKHGMYMTSPIAQQAINNPTEFLARAVLVANQELDKLKMENAVMKPKADYFDELVDRNTLTNFRDTAKMLHIGQKYFINWLLERKFVYRNVKGKLQPYSQFIANDSNNKGYFEVKEQKAKDDSWSGIQTLITPRGREAFRLLLSQKLIAG